MILETYEEHTTPQGVIKSALVWTPYGKHHALLSAPPRAAAYSVKYCDSRAELNVRFARAVGRELTDEAEIALDAEMTAREAAELAKWRARLDR